MYFLDVFYFSDIYCEEDEEKELTDGEMLRGLIVVHVACPHAVPLFEAFDHLDIFIIAVAEAHFAFHKLVVAVDHEELIHAGAHVVGTVADAEDVVLDVTHHIHVGLEA